MIDQETDGTLVVRPRGGLCNRMQVIAAAHTLARRTGKELNVVWVIDWRLGASYGSLFQPIEGVKIDVFEWEGNLREWAYATYYSVAQRRIFQWVNRQIRQYDFDLVIDNDHTKNGISREVIDHVHRSNKVFMLTNHEFIEPEVRYDQFFRLTPGLERAVHTASEKIDKNTVGVHIRRGDHGRAIRKSPENAFRRLMHREIEKNPEVTFFLASDSAETKRRFGEEFVDRIVANELTLQRDSVSGVEGAVVDLYCLAKTTKIIGSQVSTFSEMAAKIGGIEVEWAG